VLSVCQRHHEEVEGVPVSESIYRLLLTRFRFFPMTEDFDQLMRKHATRLHLLGRGVMGTAGLMSLGVSIGNQMSS